MSPLASGRILLKRSALLLCDMQEKFRPSIAFFPQIVEVSKRMMDGASLLHMPIVITEQYPKGLGPTVSELLVDAKAHNIPIFPKTQFSMAIPEVCRILRGGTEDKGTPKYEHILLCGIETHVCVLNTALQLIEEGFKVHVIADACSSRSQVDRKFAFERLRQSGVYVTTSESALLSLVCGSDHEQFKHIQKLIFEKAPPSDLL